MDVVYAMHNAYVTFPDGSGYTVTGGEHWPADDKVVRAQPGLFSSDPRYGMRFSDSRRDMAEPPVETVTAGPGEKRAQVRRG